MVVSKCDHHNKHQIEIEIGKARKIIPSMRETKKEEEGIASGCGLRGCGCNEKMV